MDKQRDNLKNLKDRPIEERKKIAQKGGKASGESRREKKRMSDIYAEFLEKEHDIIGKDGLKKKLTGQALMNSVASKILSRGDSASVSMMREIREATEGNKVAVNLEDNELVINILPTSTGKDEHQDT
jgi:hypothetical protein